MVVQVEYTAMHLTLSGLFPCTIQLVCAPEELFGCVVFEVMDAVPGVRRQRG
jgi:hypothetical protein